MKSIFITVAFLLSLGHSLVYALPSDALESGFTNPPVQTRPWCYYYWISDNVSKEGITHDLEAMKRVGIGEALIGNIFLDNQPAGHVKVLSEEWWWLVEHAIREGGDCKLPVERRLTSLSLPTVKTNAPLRAAGLLGPVTVQVSEPGK